MGGHKLRVGFGSQLKSVEIDLPKGEAVPWDASTKLSVVGKPVARIDGHLKVSGKARYTFDINVPGLLHGVVLRSPHACAVVKSIDTSAAKKRPGVRAVLAVAKPGDRLLFAGQDVAAVAATRPELARDALRHIKVVYDEQPFAVELSDAMRKDAPKVHAGKVKDRRTEGDEPGSGGGGRAQGNLRPGRPMKQGDVAKGFKRAQVVHEATYETPVVTHSSLETHGIVVRWEDKKRITVWSSTQSIFSVRDEMARIFELEAGNVHVITNFLGGGFGSKFGASAPGSRLGYIAGTLAKDASAPVKLMCDRHGEQVCTGNRPDSRQQVKIGATKGGKLTAIHVVAHGTAGIGTGAGVGRNAFGIYTRCPNRLVESTDVFTHGGPGTAMRAPGHPQGAFALELALDELAAKLGADPVALRLRHDEHPVRRHQLEIGRKRFDWDKKRKRAAKLRKNQARVRSGVGVAASIWGDFGRDKRAVATVSVTREGIIEVKNGVQDIGTGIPTVLAQVAAEVFHRPIERVVVKFGNSELGSSVGSGGSQTTSSVTPAVRNAAEQAKADLTALAAKLLKASSPSQVRWDRDGTASAGNGKSMTFDQVCKKIEGEAIVAVGTRPQTYGGHPMKFPGGPMYQIGGVQFAEVEVDTWTGVVRCSRVLAVHDCGRVMNANTVRSQINGGIVMGVGYGLTEQRIMDADLGRMLNPNLESYKLAGAHDIPDIDIVMTEVFAGNNNTGAIGIGEPATIPTAAAIANAVFDAIGAPVRSLPITPGRVLAALGKVPGRSQG